jgi:hypothetical protein
VCHVSAQFRSLLLMMFRTLQAMPTEFLWDEVSIRDADASVIIPLLLQIRRVFGHHLKRS